MNKLFIIHCGYYEQLSDTRFEMHVNLPIVAETLEDAKKQIKEQRDFVAKKMHIDGVQTLERVGNYQVMLV